MDSPNGGNDVLKALPSQLSALAVLSESSLYMFASAMPARDVSARSTKFISQR